MVRELKGLEKLIPVSVVDWLLEEGGWKFNPSRPGCTPEPLYGCQYLSELYKKADPSYSGRITVPVLWDKKFETIVNNESVDIIRMFNSAFNALLPKEKAMIDLYPEEHRKGIDELNEWIYD